MAKQSQSQYTTQLEDAITDIYNLANQDFATRADMESAFDQITDLCTDALPDLDTDDDSDDDDSES